MNRLETLVELSHYYGRNPAYVIAGGGNTSYKNEERLWIKASGISLAEITTDGFVSMSRKQLAFIGQNDYSEDPVLREEEVKNDMKKAIVCPEHLRPSVETSLHNLIDYTYIIHTHPTLVNAVMCGSDAARVIEERFGTEALFVEYTDPGYILFKKLQEQINSYREEFNTSPKIIFLQNHGIFVGANTAREVKAIYDSIESRIREKKDLSLPAVQMISYSSEASGAVEAIYHARNLKTSAFQGELVKHFSESRTAFSKISRPFTPDIIVYCKSNYLFLESGMDQTEIVNAAAQFEQNHGYYPKVVVEQGGGLIITEESEKSIQTVLEVFTDMLKISYLSEQYGGPSAMTDDQISFIDNWEVENYRRQVARI